MNTRRARAGVAQLHLEPALVRMAQRRCADLARSGVADHGGFDDLESADPDSTRELARRGWAVAEEDLAQGDVLTALRTRFLPSLYHSLGFMMPERRAIGMADTGGFAVVLLAGGPADKPALVCDPYPGEQDVGLAGHYLEDPDPFAPHRDHMRGAPAGVAVKLLVSGPPITLQSATLSCGLGNGLSAEVPVWVNHPGNDGNVGNAVSMIPRRPLEPGREYTATVEVRTKDGVLSRTWSFRTVKAPQRPLPSGAR